MSTDPTPDDVDITRLERERHERGRAVLADHAAGALLSADPVTIRYLTGTRNMLVHGFTGPDRLVLLVDGGPCVLWEFAGCEHLSARATHVDDLRPAPGLNAKKTPGYRSEARDFAREIRVILGRAGVEDEPVAVEALGHAALDALTDAGLELTEGTEISQRAMAIKQPTELDAMRAAMALTEAGTRAMEAALRPGLTEQQLWSVFLGEFTAGGGELVVTRLLQAGERTFPYFQEASDHPIGDGDLVCFDTDAVAVHGYSVDFSRTFLAGDGAASPRQRELYGLAREQLRHNAANLAPGRGFESFARAAFDVPEPFRDHGYYQLAHGLGLLGGAPNVPRAGDGPYPLPGEFEPGMVVCVESYVGDPATRQGVKLEDQFHITESGVETMSTHPFDPRLGG